MVTVGLPYSNEASIFYLAKSLSKLKTTTVLKVAYFLPINFPSEYIYVYLPDPNPQLSWDESISKPLSAQFITVGKSKHLLNYLRMAETKEWLDFGAYVCKQEKNSLIQRMNGSFITEISERRGWRKEIEGMEKSGFLLCILCQNRWSTNFPCYLIGYS